MAIERQRIVLGVLVVALAVALYWALGTGGATRTAGTTAQAANRAAGRQGAAADAPATAPDVHLQALSEERPKPESTQRDLFRFGQRPAPAPAQPPPMPPPIVNQAPGGFGGPGAPGPIPLRFIGIVEAPNQAKRLAALVDTTGHAYQGGEGDIVAGQYRVLKIGVESIEMSYLDGRGQQTIRLSGS